MDSLPFTSAEIAAVNVSALGTAFQAGAEVDLAALKAAGLVVAAALPAAAWLLRNLSLTGTLTGGRTPAAGSVATASWPPPVP